MFLELFLFAKNMKLLTKATTAMGPQKYKNKTQKYVDFPCTYFGSFFFVCAPLWAGRINEKNKNKNETEVRGLLIIKVSSPQFEF